MSELKTLKDIDQECKYMHECCKHCIKEEAIKWVKHLRKKLDEEKEMDPYEAGIICGASEGVLIKFFNITEEELKEAKENE